MRQFTRDNNCSIEFDAFGFSVKDFKTKQVLLRCDSSGDLYPVTAPSPQVFVVLDPSVWHQRLGHPGDSFFEQLVSGHFINCNKNKSKHLCPACQAGKHVRLPFSRSDSSVSFPFDIIHSDVWTSPLLSHSGLKYYVIFLDQYSHYVWVYPLKNKSDVFDKILHFRAYVRTQFNCEIKSF